MPAQRPTRRSQTLPRDRALKHLANGRLADARVWAQSAKSELEDSQDLLAAAKILRADGDRDSVIAIYQHLAAEQPDNRNLRLGFACSLAEAGRKEELAGQLSQLRKQQEPAAIECVMLASAFRGGGHTTDAVNWYQAAMDAGDDSAGTAIEMASLKSQLGHADVALGILQGVVSKELDAVTAARAWFNLGLLYERDDAVQAINAFTKSLSLNPDYQQPIPNLAILLIGQGQLEDAMALLQPVVASRVDWPRSGMLFASATRLVGKPSDAAKVLEEVIGSKQCSPMAWEMLVRCHIDAADIAKAVEACQRWLERDPESSIARHMLSAVQGEAAPARASADYVAETFDGFADSFDSVLANLEYRAPQLVGSLVQTTLGEPNGALNVLDAGCGTGLAGPYLRDYAARLVGVDLSEKMLEHAARRRGYDELLHADLVQHLQQHKSKYDLIVAADTFNYFGDLSDLLTACFESLTDKGWLVFTLESGDMFGNEYRLESHGRYSHPPQYLMDRLGERGVRGGDIHQPVLRKENGVDVQGLLVAVQKPDNPQIDLS